MLSAAWGAHERLLGLLGVDVRDVEEKGWARLTPHSWQCRYKLSREQKKRVEQSGFLVDSADERLKPHWRPPVALSQTVRLQVTGTSSSANLPSAQAVAARWWLRAA